ncbi:MAG: lipid-A-disaccharide synthase [Hyphomonadaceae bacterium]
MTGIFLVAAEASGDAIGADVIDELVRIAPDIRLQGVGGAAMARRGVQSDIDMSGLAVLGLIDGLKAYGRVKKAVVATADVIMTANPDAVVLIDSWGFMWRLARELKLRGSSARLIKLVGPQVWATRPGRARVLAKWTDHLICIHPFEPPFYEPWGLPTTVMGNPAIGRMEKGDGERARRKFGLPDATQAIGLLPGSRRSELKRVAPTLAAACNRLCEAHSNLHVVCPVAPSVRDEIRAMAKTWTFPHTLVEDETDKADAMAAMTVAIACSGTVTTELAEQGAAVVTGYKLGWVTWTLARAFLMRTKFISLVNIAANAEVIPEFVQTRLSVARIAATVETLLNDPDKRALQISAQFKGLESMAAEKEPAPLVAARAILSETGKAGRPAS